MPPGCQILRLKCTKFDFHWVSATEPVEGAYSAPPGPITAFQGATSEGKEGIEKGEGKRREGEEICRTNVKRLTEYALCSPLKIKNDYRRCRE